MDVNNKPFSATKIIEALLDHVRDDEDLPRVGMLRDVAFKVLPKGGADFTRVKFAKCNVGGYWKLDAFVNVDDQPSTADYRDGSINVTIRRGTSLFPAEDHTFYARFCSWTIANGYVMAEFEKRDEPIEVDLLDVLDLEMVVFQELAINDEFWNAGGPELGVRFKKTSEKESVQLSGQTVGRVSHDCKGSWLVTKIVRKDE